MGLNAKELSFWAIGLITLVYCVIELGVAVWKHSLTLMSDGFHNLSDVISLYIAFWASRASKRDASDEMSYGWARTELLGGLTNGVFLVSLSLYIVLEAIPEFIEPQSITKDEGLWYIGIAAGGLLVNTIGTVVFAITGQSHGHSHAHGHSHGGGHGHSHGGDHHDEHDEEHGHGHGHGESEEHGHGHGHGEKKKKKHGHGHSHGEEDDHGHGHGHGESEEHGHGHGHGEKKKKKHGHSHGEEEHLSLRDLSNDSAHASDSLLPEKKKKKKKRDMNVHAVFLHYLGDMLSSFFVLIAGIIMYYSLNHVGDDGLPPTWPEYIDPSASLVIVVLILVTTVPLVKRCAYILLQSTPSHLDLKKIRHDIKRVDGVIGVHDFHVWQLVDGMVIASIHVKVQDGCDFGEIARKTKKIFHRQGIHSTAIQPEFAAHPMGPTEFCEQNCVDDCKEEWCCKKVAEKSMAQLPLAASTPYNSLNHL